MRNGDADACHVKVYKRCRQWIISSDASARIGCMDKRRLRHCHNSRSRSLTDAIFEVLSIHQFAHPCFKFFNISEFDFVFWLALIFFAPSLGGEFSPFFRLQWRIRSRIVAIFAINLISTRRPIAIIARKKRRQIGIVVSAIDDFIDRA